MGITTLTSHQHPDTFLDWEAEAQEAACNFLCFALLPEGRLINADRLASNCFHSGPYDRNLTLPDSFSGSQARRRKATNENEAKQRMSVLVSTLTRCTAAAAANAPGTLEGLPAAA